MSVSVERPAFDQRLADARKTLFIRLALAAAIWIAAFALAVLALLVIADYWLELPASSRTGGLVFLAAAASLWSIHCGRRIGERVSRVAAARGIERQFPSLGQAPRTHVQFALHSRDQIEHDGVDSRLVDALAAETNRSTQAIDLTELVPRRRLYAPVFASLIPLACFVWFAIQGGDWRTAMRRCLTLGGSYTTIAVQPGPEFILAGQPLLVNATFGGRSVSDAAVQFRRRSSGGAWQLCVMQPSSQSAATPDAATAGNWTATIESVREPLEYRIIADDGVSRELSVDVRQWLRLESLQAHVRPPAYTGVAEFTSADGNLNAPEGSEVEFVIGVDRQVRQAAIVHLQGDAETSRIPLDVQGRMIRGSFAVSRPQAYRIEAATEDGSPLEEHRYTIDVQRNQPPSVALEEAPPVLEMNPIAELETRIRVRDEFGISRFGIVYWVNADDPKTLLLRDTSSAATPIREVSETTNLLLEELALDQHDSVTYYAFAEDNTPGRPQRTETDPHFLDIRPFRRVYLPGGQCNGGGRCLSIDELISRERSNLTRSFRAAAMPAGETPTADELSPVVRYELGTADMTRQFAKGAEAFLGEDVQYLYQAEAAMRRAATVLMQGDARSAKEEQNQAVHRLILARDTVLTALKRNRAGAGQFIKFDHRERQKMRRPTDDDELIAEIVDQLRRLAANENTIHRRLTDADAKARELAAKWSDRSPFVDLAAQQESIAESAEAMDEFGQSRDDLSSVARERLRAASQAARQAAEQLARQERDNAAETVADAALMLREAADQVEGQLAGSLARRLDAARSLSELMTRRMEELANLVPGDGQATALPGRGKNKHEEQQPTPSRPNSQRGSSQQSAMARGSGTAGQESSAQQRQASRLSDSTQALDDLLDSISRHRSADAASAAAAVQQLRGEGLPEQARRALRRFREQASSGDAEKMQAEARAAAGAMRSLSARLDRIRQSVVQRQLDRVRAAEQRARSLEQRLNTARNPRAAEEWLKDVQLFSAELGELGEHELAVRLNDQLFPEGATKAENQAQSGPHHGQIGGAFREIIAVLQARAQRETMNELEAGALEAIPAEYQAYVERYYQVLSQNAAPSP